MTDAPAPPIRASPAAPSSSPAARAASARRSCGPSPAQGAKVGFVDIMEEAGRGARRRARAGGRGRSVSRRSTSPTSRRCRRRLRAIAAALGPIAVLVNNAANDTRHDWRTETPESFDARLAVNLKHQFFAIQAVAPGHDRGRRRLDRQFRLDLLADRHGRHAGLHGVQGGDRGADALLRARPRHAPHPRQHACCPAG